MTAFETVIAVIGALGLRELIPVIFSLFFKRKEDIDSTAISNVGKLEYGNREQILFLKQQLAEAYQELDKTQDFLNGKRAVINELSRRVYSLELELEKLKEEKKNFFCDDIKCENRKQNF